MMKHSVILLVLLQTALIMQAVSSIAFLPSLTSDPKYGRGGRRRTTTQVDAVDHMYSTTPTSESESPPHLVFPGGGIFFYWQAGAVSYLREQGYNLTAVTAAGASAGALTATLAATGVDFYQATALALELAEKAGIWDRSGGLQGIWGPMIYDWLDELLPENAVERIENGRLSLLVTPLPKFGKKKINAFKDRNDLIRCNMASIHLPWFLNGELTSNFRDQPCIDGSFLSKGQDYLPEQKASSVLILDYNRDPTYESTKMLDFVTAMSPDGIWKMFEDGKKYARQMDEQGLLVSLPKVQTQRRRLNWPSLLDYNPL
jgi:predicted acylesterase/phospholipase RssA